MMDTCLVLEMLCFPHRYLWKGEGILEENHISGVLVSGIYLKCPYSSAQSELSHPFELDVGLLGAFRKVQIF